MRLGIVHTQGEWLEKIGSHPRIASQLKNYTVGFRLHHIKNAVELVNADYNFVFGFRGSIKCIEMRAVKESLKGIIREMK